MAKKKPKRTYNAQGRLGANQTLTNSVQHSNTSKKETGTRIF